MKILRTPEIFSGEGSLKQVINITKKIGVRRVLVISGRNIVKFGIYQKLEDILNNAGIEYIGCDKVEPEPSIDLISQIVSFARASRAEAVIGLGGGSSLDTAKIAAALVTNHHAIEKYIGIELFENNPVPVIAVPTTAGTGSEVTPVAVLSDPGEQLKKAIYSTKMIPSFAILDPSLTLDLPKSATASSGMDALTHAIEAYTSVHANIYTDTLALRAVSLLMDNIRIACSGHADVKVREDMLIGSLLAGMAFTNAGVAAVHAFANPLGGMFHVPHGIANSLMLSTIMAFNAVGNEDKFTEIARCLTKSENATIDRGIDEINKLCDDLTMPVDLRAAGIPEDAISKMAERVMKSPILLTNNRRSISYEDASELYRKAYIRR